MSFCLQLLWHCIWAKLILYFFVPVALSSKHGRYEGEQFRTSCRLWDVFGPNRFSIHVPLLKSILYFQTISHFSKSNFCKDFFSLLSTFIFLLPPLWELACVVCTQPFNESVSRLQECCLKSTSLGLGVAFNPEPANFPCNQSVGENFFPRALFYITFSAKICCCYERDVFL